MGVSQLSTQSSLKPAAEVGSSSLEAQRYFQRAKQEFERYHMKESRHCLELALNEDSTFAIAWKLRGAIYLELHDIPAARDAYRNARKNAAKATERERFFIAENDSSLRASLLKSRGRTDVGKDVRAFIKARAEIFPFDAEFTEELCRVTDGWAHRGGDPAIREGA